jgi:peptidoglycan-N-acetylglucosamine deacetylase
MKPYLVKTPKLVKWIFPKRIWAFPKDNTSIYLTFDDGPIPEVTPWVLQKLKKYNAKATFFCIGDNIKKHPEIFKAVLSEGHAIGNHTFNHLNGWKTETSTYVENVLKASKTIQESKNIKRQLLFRPPFGRISQKHFRG